MLLKSAFVATADIRPLEYLKKYQCMGSSSKYMVSSSPLLPFFLNSILPSTILLRITLPTLPIAIGPCETYELVDLFHLRLTWLNVSDVCSSLGSFFMVP